MKRLIPILMLTLTACKTIELGHIDLECREMPPMTEYFSDEENASIDNKIKQKLARRANQYKSTIKTICSDIEVHNKEHGKSK